MMMEVVEGLDDALGTKKANFRQKISDLIDVF
jgi:hypothetical protein